MYAVYPYIMRKTVRCSYKCMDFLRLTHIMASILFVINRQTVQTKIRRRKTSPLFAYRLPYQDWNNNEKYHQQPLKPKWTGPINNSAKFYSA